uniref:Uncharacterized protein n=1 Tax=Acrobeloides nanus TaxID=290746 RepID=A0A914E451_9BILA
MRDNLGMAILCMVNVTAYEATHFVKEFNHSDVRGNFEEEKYTNLELSDADISKSYQGCIFPAIATLSSRWFLPIERSTAAAIFTSGYQLGNGVDGH